MKSWQFVALAVVLFAMADFAVRAIGGEFQRSSVVYDVYEIETDCEQP